MTIHTFHVGGCELQLLSLCKALKSYNLNLMIVYSHIRTSQKNILLDGVSCIRVPWFFQKFRLTHLYLNYLFKFRLKEPPSLFHCHAISPFTEQILWFANRHRIPAIVKVTTDGHMSTLKHCIETRGSILHWCKHLLKKEPFQVKKSKLEIVLFGANRRQTFSSPTGYVCINPQIAQELSDFSIPENRIFHIPNGINPYRFKPIRENQKRGLKTELGLPPDQQLIVMAARFIERKRFQDLILAWAQIEQSYPSHTLVLIGDGEERAPCESLVISLQIPSRVIFTGMQNQIEKYLQAASIFVFPSRREGLPNVILEAMASALPIIATSISGIREVIQTGVEGLLVPPMNIKALTQSLCHMLDHPLEASIMGAAARQKAINRYSFDTIAPQFAALYKKLIANQNNFSSN